MAAHPVPSHSAADAFAPLVSPRNVFLPEAVTLPIQTTVCAAVAT